MRNAAAVFSATCGVLILCPQSVTRADTVADARSLFDAVPAPPATLAAAGSATQVTVTGGNSTFTAPAYVAIESKLKAQLAAASAPQGTMGGIDLARAQHDPAYAAQIQARMQAMTTQEKMAFAQQMSATHAAGGAGTGVVAAFIGGQRTADQTAQGKMRSELEGALTAAGARHKALDAQLAAQAKSCPTDKTGWPESRCTSALGDKSIAEHRAIEEAALPQESKAFADARALAAAELAKARAVAAQADGASAASLAAWVGTYTELLRVYAEAMTLRAGFWAHANNSKYTGQVSIYVGNPDDGIVWPLTHPQQARADL
jgi:hypothetical protein